jgi:hypothetical protein
VTSSAGVFEAYPIGFIHIAEYLERKATSPEPSTSPNSQKWGEVEFKSTNV